MPKGEQFQFAFPLPTAVSESHKTLNRSQETRTRIFNWDPQLPENGDIFLLVELGWAIFTSNTFFLIENGSIKYKRHCLRIYPTPKEPIIDLQKLYVIF